MRIVVKVSLQDIASARSMEERVLRFLLDDLALDLCFEIHRQVSVDGMTLEELHEVEPIVARKAEAPVDEPSTLQRAQSLVVSCCRCARQVHASRYTAHLEKCMSGSRRQVSGAERHALATQNERRQLEALSRPPMPSASLSQADATALGFGQ